MNLRPIGLLISLNLVTGVVGGCSQGPVPVGVTGEVTLDGKPISEGRVRFEPLDAKQGQSRDVAIHEGKFALPASEGQLSGLEFKVIINAFRKTGRKYPNADMAASYDEVIQYLPDQYNSASTLRAVISPDEEENHFEFHLKPDEASRKAMR